MIFIRPIYNAEADYLIWLFAGGFLLFTYADENFIRYTLYCLVGIFIALSIWGLIQYTTGYAYLISMGHRANSIFITPNTFAASINIILLPTIVLYLIGSKSSRYLFIPLLILFSALLVTQSRGGWVAFVSSIILISILIKFLSIKLGRIRLKKLTIGLTIVFVAYNVINLIEYDRFSSDYSINEDFKHLIRSDSIVSTMSQRYKLYGIAWQQIKQNPLLGHGFHTYQYYKSRDHQASYVGDVTRFAHNDYLQLWMETGVFGVVLFIMLFIVMVYFLITLFNKISNREKTIMLAIISGLTSFYVHALVDFVFYVPFLLLMFACGLGIFNQIVNKYYQPAYVIDLSCKFIRFNLQKSLIGVVIVCLLSQPAIAQLVYGEAVRRTQQLDINGAFPFYELARRFAPYESDYYWYEGAVLMNAVKSRQHKNSAKRADDLFSKGMAVSPYAANNRLARAELHRDYDYLLTNPEDLNVVLSWNEEALYWRPNDPVIRAEYLKTLMAMGEYDKASILLDSYILQSPESEVLFEFKESLQKNG
jgi:O-antigen ligase